MNQDPPLVDQGRSHPGVFHARAAGGSWPWRSSILLGFCAVYLPSAAMALFTLTLVRCDHCKKAALFMAPVGPGFPPVFTAFRRMTGSPPPEWTMFGLAFVLSMGAVLAVAALARAGRAWGAIPAFLLSCFLSWATLSLIRA